MHTVIFCTRPLFSHIIFLFFQFYACRHVIATTPTMSSAAHPLDRSLTGRLSPCVTGPYASAFASLCTSLYPIFPLFKSGTIKTFALPATLLPLLFIPATFGSRAASTFCRIGQHRDNRLSFCYLFKALRRG